MSRAGQANEAGSVFRCFVATYVAVHAFRSRPIPGLELPTGVDPIRLDFETSEPTDDIRVTFSDGRRAYISAKRRVTKGKPLSDTVKGWIEQASTLRPDDILVLAGEEYSGSAKDIEAALKRHRRGLPMDTLREKNAFAAIDNLLESETHGVVIDHARFMHLPNSTTGDDARALLAALMDSALVEGEGHRAVVTLSELFHRESGSALGSGIEDWIAILEGAGLSVIRDSRGPAGLRIAARIAAIEAYRSRLSADVGRIDLSLLAEDLPPIVNGDLLTRLRVDVEGSRASSELLPYVRRWRRILILGSPGSGKSVALREIANHCINYPHAPVPIRVALCSLLERAGSGIAIENIVDQAVRDAVTDQHHHALFEHLAEEVKGGRAIILCDGLDECGHRTAWVAQQLADVLKSLHPRTGFVLTTRGSSEIAAERLGLPRVELTTPSDLRHTVERVLSTCAEVRLPVAQRAEWLDIRRQWLAEAAEQHGQLLAVPLLALLLALVCANASDEDLPKGRATLLHQAVVHPSRDGRRHDRLSHQLGRGSLDCQ